MFSIYNKFLKFNLILYLSNLQVIMPWKDLVGILIIRPNGSTICQFMCHPNKKQEKQQSQDINIQTIKSQVIQASRKLPLQAYENSINRTIIDASFIEYRAKFNVLVIIILRHLHVSQKIISNVIQKVLNIFIEKCISMTGKLQIPKKITIYQSKQFQKLDRQIQNFLIEQYNSRLRRINSFNRQTTALSTKFEDLSNFIFNRDQKLKSIGKNQNQMEEVSLKYKQRSKFTVQLLKIKKIAALFVIGLVCCVSVWSYISFNSQNERET